MKKLNELHFIYFFLITIKIWYIFVEIEKSFDL